VQNGDEPKPTEPAPVEPVVPAVPADPKSAEPKPAEPAAPPASAPTGDKAWETEMAAMKKGQEEFQSSTLKESRELLDRVMTFSTFREIEEYVRRYMIKRFPDVFPLSDQ